MCIWTPIIGKFKILKETLTFSGDKHIWQDDQGKDNIGAKFGIILTNQIFNEGVISLDVKFKKIDFRSSCQIIFNYDPTTGNYMYAGISSRNPMFEIGAYINGKLETYKSGGQHENLTAGKTYNIKLTLKGSWLRLLIDGVHVLTHVLPYNIVQTQVGMLCMGQTDIKVSNYKVVSEKPKVFMIMQFSDKYNDIYENVVKEVCNSKDFDLNVFKADEIYGPGIIITDIIRYINESKIIIAEISPANANVYYEVGYAHALNKPTILIAEKDSKPPFDISPFRVLFYENTIAGKKKVQDGLKKHLDSILNSN